MNYIAFDIYKTADYFYFFKNIIFSLNIFFGKVWILYIRIFPEIFRMCFLSLVDEVELDVLCINVCSWFVSKC